MPQGIGSSNLPLSATMEPRISYYNDTLKRFGSGDPRALAWRDSESQITRFEILAQVGDLSGASVLDEGCGLGDLYPFLTKRFEAVTYHGVDINEQLIEAARAKYPNTSFEIGDFSSYEGKSFDYVLASGTISFNIPNHRAVYFAQIQKMFEIAQKAVAFNFLNAVHFEGNDLYVTYSREEMLEFCHTITKNITIRDDYSREDFTFYLYK
jgi:trans-aconitate methyltransferase